MRHAWLYQASRISYMSCLVPYHSLKCGAHSHKSHYGYHGYHSRKSSRLVRLVADKSNDHAVEVEEEHEQVEAQLDEGFLLVHIEFPEDLRCV